MTSGSSLSEAYPSSSILLFFDFERVDGLKPSTACKFGMEGTALRIWSNPLEEHRLCVRSLQCTTRLCRQISQASWYYDGSTA
jgi:hypothetical protein